MVRPRALPTRAPSGRHALPLPSDRHQQHPGYGLTPERLVAILRHAERGYPADQCDLFEDLVEVDGHLRNLFEQRRQAVSGKPWVIQAGGSDAADHEAAVALADAIGALPDSNFIEFLEHQLSFGPYGWAASEIDWDLVDGQIRPTHLATVPHRRFRIGEHQELLLRTREFSQDGEPLAPGKWVVTKRSGGKLARAGLMRTAAWYALFKRYGTRDWIVYAEKFGIPLVLASYDEAADDEAKRVAEDIVENIGDDGGAVIPKSIEVKVESAARDGDGGDGAVHPALISYCNREMSKLVNGSTLSNDNGDSGGASYALGRTHDTVRFEAVMYDAERIQEAFRSGLAAPFVRFNGLAGKPPLLKMQVVRDLTPAVRADVAERMSNIGLELSKQQLRQELGFKEPAGDDDILAPSRPQREAA